MRNKIEAVRELADLTEKSVRYGTSTQLSDFFQSQILDPFDENLRKLPKFYVIPKKFTRRQYLLDLFYHVIL